MCKTSYFKLRTKTFFLGLARKLDFLPIWVKWKKVAFISTRIFLAFGSDLPKMAQKIVEKTAKQCPKRS